MTQRFENMGKGKITGYILVAAAIVTITGVSLKDFWTNTNNETNTKQHETVTFQYPTVKSVKDDNSGKLEEEDNIEYVNLDILGIAIAKKDVNNGAKLSWEDANNLCKNSILGGHKGWRLPSLDELTTIFQIKNNIGGFSNEWYWTSTESGYRIKSMKALHMGEGTTNSNSSYDYRCRCVRTTLSELETEGRKE